jgi:type I site-specific restriction-modification system R (restriction) subunit
MEDLKTKNDKLVDEVLHLVDIIEEKDKKIEYLENKLNKIIIPSGSSG